MGLGTQVGSIGSMGEQVGFTRRTGGSTIHEEVAGVWEGLMASGGLVGFVVALGGIRGYY